MALEYQAAQAKQSSTVVATMIHPLFECRYDRISGKCGHFRENITGKLYLQEVDDHGRQPLTGFQGHIADKSIAHDDVDSPLENIIAFDVAKKIKITRFRGRSKQFTCFLD